MTTTTEKLELTLKDAETIKQMTGFYTTDPIHAQLMALYENLIAKAHHLSDLRAAQEREDEPGYEECPGCHCKPGDGLTAGCEDNNGCGYWRLLAQEYEMQAGLEEAPNPTDSSAW